MPAPLLLALAAVPAVSRPTPTAVFAVRVQVVQTCTLAFDKNHCGGSAGQPPVRVIREKDRTVYEF